MEDLEKYITTVTLFKCILCDFQDHCKSRLSEHMKSHLINKCTFCDQSFLHQQGLSDHIKTHHSQNGGLDDINTHHSPKYGVDSDDSDVDFGVELEDSPPQTPQCTSPDSLQEGEKHSHDQNNSLTSTSEKVTKSRHNHESKAIKSCTAKTEQTAQKDTEQEKTRKRKRRTTSRHVKKKCLDVSKNKQDNDSCTAEVFPKRSQGRSQRTKETQPVVSKTSIVIEDKAIEDEDNPKSGPKKLKDTLVKSTSVKETSVKSTRLKRARKKCTSKKEKQKKCTSEKETSKKCTSVKSTSVKRDSIKCTSMKETGMESTGLKDMSLEHTSMNEPLVKSTGESSLVTPVVLPNAVNTQPQVMLTSSVSQNKVMYVMAVPNQTYGVNTNTILQAPVMPMHATPLLQPGSVMPSNKTVSEMLESAKEQKKSSDTVLNWFAQTALQQQSEAIAESRSDASNLTSALKTTPMESEMPSNQSNTLDSSGNENRNGEVTLNMNNKNQQLNILPMGTVTSGMLMPVKDASTSNTVKVKPGNTTIANTTTSNIITAVPRSNIITAATSSVNNVTTAPRPSNVTSAATTNNITVAAPIPSNQITAANRPSNTTTGSTPSNTTAAYAALSNSLLFPSKQGLVPAIGTKESKVKNGVSTGKKQIVKIQAKGCNSSEGENTQAALDDGDANNIIQMARMKADKLTKELRELTARECEFCDRRFSSGRSLGVHQRRLHADILSKMNSTGGPFSCNRCSYYTPYKACIEAHLKRHDKHLKCKICSKDFLVLEALKRHEKEHEGLSDNKAMLCDTCGYQTNNRFSFKEHLASHMEEKPLKCEQCDYRTASKKNLTRHKFQVHNETKVSCLRFTCPKCVYTCKSQLQYKIHLDSHNGISKFKCPACKVSTNYLRNFKTHLKKKHKLVLIGTADNYKIVNQHMDDINVDDAIAEIVTI